VVELNRAVAVGMTFGPAEGLAVAEPLQHLAAMKDHHLLAAVVADLLCRNGQHDESWQEFLRAAALTRNDRECTVMLERAARCSMHASGSAVANSQLDG
jgi:predicted RNA polymerase sigma factor